MGRALAWAVALAYGVACLSIAAAQPFAHPCPRLPAGSNYVEPVNLFSSHGLLTAELRFMTRLSDDARNTYFCYMMPDGLSQAPTLRVSPGDRLVLTLKNLLPPNGLDTGPPARATTVVGRRLLDNDDGGASTNAAADASTVTAVQCGSHVTTNTSTNLHFHGTPIRPVCEGDQAIHTLVNSGQAFVYDMVVPLNTPPGMHWYHPHVHGLAEFHLLGGAAGALIVEGLESTAPSVAGLPERQLIFRDNYVPGGPPPVAGSIPTWDVSVNYIPVPFLANYTPAVIPMPGGPELWRLLNACSDTLMDLQLLYDGVPQPLTIVALDGVALGSAEGTTVGRVDSTQTHVQFSTGSRLEMVVGPPPPGVTLAQLVSAYVDVGPAGDSDTARPLATLVADPAAPALSYSLPDDVAPRPAFSIAGADYLLGVTPSANRTLVFSESPKPDCPRCLNPNFYVTVAGAVPTLFSGANAPAIVTTQGAIEDWTVQNSALEAHVFHIHQMHFLLMARNGVPSPEPMPYLDTVFLEAWSGDADDPYPSVTLRLPFLGPIAGDFVYHCHILEHEDNGMMAIIRVLPALPVYIPSASATGTLPLGVLVVLLSFALGAGLLVALLGGRELVTWVHGLASARRGGAVGPEEATSLLGGEDATKVTDSKVMDAKVAAPPRAVAALPPRDLESQDDDVARLA